MEEYSGLGLVCCGRAEGIGLGDRGFCRLGFGRFAFGFGAGGLGDWLGVR